MIFSAKNLPKGLSLDKAPGHWNDPDMLIVGWVGWGRPEHPSNLTADEQYTHISAWRLTSVPLLLVCDLTKLDNFSYNLLSDDEVLAVNQDPLGKQATVVSRLDDTGGILAKQPADGSYAAGLFNTADAGVKSITLKWADLGLKGEYTLRDLWRQKDLGLFDGEFKVDVAQHGVVMVQLKAVK